MGKDGKWWEKVGTRESEDEEMVASEDALLKFRELNNPSCALLEQLSCISSSFRDV